MVCTDEAPLPSTSVTVENSAHTPLAPASASPHPETSFGSFGSSSVLSGDGHIPEYQSKKDPQPRPEYQSKKNHHLKDEQHRRHREDECVTITAAVTPGSEAEDAYIRHHVSVLWWFTYMMYVLVAMTCTVDSLHFLLLPIYYCIHSLTLSFSHSLTLSFSHSHSLYMHAACTSREAT
jgi:hypothetical protein